MNNIIVPYDDKLYGNEGAFINPKGEIIFTFGQHEKYAKNYCLGKDYDILRSIKNIDEFQTSKLTSEELKTFKLWLDYYLFSKEFNHRNPWSDFMVYILQFDKVETVMRRCITTTCKLPHIRFYNYYLMDYKIVKQNPMEFNAESNTFEFISDENWMIKYKEDREVKEEIDKIKKQVLLKDRYLFFK